MNTLKTKIKENLKTVKGQVLFCLRTMPNTRNSDRDLQAAIWTTFYAQKPNDDSVANKLKPLKVEVSEETGVKNYFMKVTKVYADGTISINPAFEKLPLGETVKRTRADIQNKHGMYLPTNLEVALNRDISAEAHAEYYGHK